MPSYYLALESKEYYRQGWTSPPSFGFNTRFKELAEKMRPNDMIVDYVTRGGGYACIVRVLPWETGKCCEYKPKLGTTGSAFPWRVRVEPNLQLQIDKFNQMPKYSELESYLECCRRVPRDPNSPLKNPQWLRGKHLLLLSRHDFLIIEEAMRKALQTE